MSLIRFVLATFCMGVLLIACAADTRIFDEQMQELPQPGAHELLILTPTVLELTLVTTKDPDPARVKQWDFVDAAGQLHLPDIKNFVVLADGKQIAVKSVGFKRRVLYAPLKKRDLRINNWLYLILDSPVASNQTIEVKTTSPALWSADVHFTAKSDPQRLSPVIHVNQVGFVPEFPKTAMVGYYLGSLGELNLDSANTNHTFSVVESQSGKEIFHGQLKPRRDKGFTFACYQQVWEADFTDLKTPGEYRLSVAGLGVSLPFRIDDGVAATFARTYALGLYHQRCGTDNKLPFTRFTHDACHTNPAQIPTLSREFSFVNGALESLTAETKMPRLKNIAASLYPFVNQGTVDVSGGHHDAGDYSKYTINSAALIHQLVFAADSFSGVGELDNLGLPESGDGKSDILQEAKWEADFLAKMQDADGGFYFMVYPKNRPYENDVTPDHGDPQVVWPKNTAATAAAVAALAECASSPLFKIQFPEAAALYLKKAKLGWDFLERAIAKYGKDGAYQKITHYGDDFTHDDELAWAATEMFIATGDPNCRKRVLEWLHPTDPATRKWGWWRLCGSYGNAIRSYAFAAKTGKISRDQLSPILLRQCEDEIIAAANDQFQRAQDCAYGSSLPGESKRIPTAGWYFSADAAFDLAVACQLDEPPFADPRPKFLRAILSNLDYEAGGNPVNVTFITGLGTKRQREIVHQFAENDRRVLPPSGIPLGNMQTGFGWLDFYQRELGALTFPPDGDTPTPYPIYDRWGDSFNVSTEFVIVNQGRALAYSTWLMAQTPERSQPWRAQSIEITGLPANARVGETVTVKIAPQRSLGLSDAQIVWETRDHEPAFGNSFTFAPANAGSQWLEVEALLTDGRRMFAVTNLNVR